ncbi:hypothetical protein [Rhodococcus sp. X156]|uniref:hypothetical protein n=1 Tax=Rhodococcus sp. X156 TaxID=2499145 RepID=UPI000FD6EC85|nr:hypothetical protein [Rhodococcus sp. X156]
MTRLLVTAGLLGAIGVLAGCGGSPAQPAPQTTVAPPASSVSAPPSTPPPVPAEPAPRTTLAPPTLAPSATTRPVTPTTAAPTPAAPTSRAAAVSLPPNLCAATDRAQDTADAFMGSLSAGQVAEASKCVAPGAVPAELVASLAGQQRQTAGYAPVGGGEGPVFTYRGDGRTVLVTVSRLADGATWVTGLVVR